jgi:uncharacterized protein (TIGR02421 family)
MSHHHATLELDHLMHRLVERTRLLPLVTARNARAERTRLVQCLARGAPLHPRYVWAPPLTDRRLWHWLAEARTRAEDVPGATLYLGRLDELELELEMLAVLGDTRRVPALAARRFGTGATPVVIPGGPVPLGRMAAALLGLVEDEREPRTVPADHPSPGVPSVAGVMRGVVAAAGLSARVLVEPRLAAGAAAGERTVLVADRCFGRRETLRLAVHEVLGHLVSAANGRAQPVRLLSLGTAGWFADQEGLAILLEERAGVLDGRRMRTLAARVVAADHMHAGMPFGETARALVDDHGFCPEDAIAITERAYRGGGVARDVGYLLGYLRVRGAVEGGEATLDELRAGRVSLRALPEIRRLEAQGVARGLVYRPSLSRSLRATHWGTSFSMSPPSEAASLTRFDAT